MDRFDVAVIGAGPGGYVAAVRAAQMEGRIAVVERGNLGGTCLNWGCIPTKTMLTAAKFLNAMERAHEFGVRGETSLDWPALLKKKNRVILRLRKGIEVLLRKHSIRLVHGTARIVSRGMIEVVREDGSTETVSARAIIVSTGSCPTGLPGLEIDGDRILDSRHALDLEKPPESLLVVGAGAIGCEFAHLLSSVGTRVIIVELMDELLPLVADPDVSGILHQVFRKRGIEIHLGVRVVSAEKGPGGVSVTLEDGARFEVERVLVSVGRRPNTDGLGLEDAGVEVTRHGIVVDPSMKTTAEGFWAVGDATGKNALAHVASAQGVVAAENAMGGSAVLSYDAIPSCVFVEPEIATVGLTEVLAEKEGRPVSVGRFPWMALGRAHATGETTGFVKVLVDRESDRVVGGQVVGPEAASVISEIALAIHAGVPPGRLVETVHAHPTYPEGVAEAVGAAVGRAIHA
ncbi:MAG: dihydrolipoyl dehydrogenase [Candidatus Eisenbacteria sp.]|nr:dihydrolipoyl dehydrogenase [Candidatus Eisenbacteria bacterium]